MNMPKRASCHHFMRRMRSASLADGAVAACAGVDDCPKPSTELKGSVAAAKTEPLPIIQSRRDVVLRVIARYLRFMNCCLFPSPRPHGGEGERRRANKERRVHW